MEQQPYKKTLSVILIIHFIGIYLLSASYSPLLSDMIENLLWGKNLTFLNEKHPPFFSWESYLTVRLFGNNLLSYHILTPLHQITLLYFSFCLAKSVLQSPYKALVTVILLQGIFFHTFYYKFNANTANYGFFSAIYYLFYLALKDKNYKLFIPTSILCAIVIMIKYSAILLFFSMVLTVVFTKEGRNALKSPFIYFGIFIFIALLSPFIFHLMYNEFGKETFAYAQTQTVEGAKRWFEIPRFLAAPIIFSVPLLISFIKIKKHFIKRELNFDTVFLLINCLVPFVVTFIIIFKSHIGFYWLSMFYSLIPLCLLYFWDIKQGALRTSIKIIYPIVGLILVLYILINLISPKADINKISQFTQEVTQGKVKNFICNGSKKHCGFIFIYGTKMDSGITYTPLRYYKNSDFTNSLIIGDIVKLDLSKYNIETFTREIPAYYPIKSIKTLIQKLNIDNNKPTHIKLTIVTKKHLS